MAAKKPIEYKDAGVDIDEADRAVRRGRVGGSDVVVRARSGRGSRRRPRRILRRARWRAQPGVRTGRGREARPALRLNGLLFLVAAFRQAGADVYAATTGQGLISDPIDKVTTFFTVYLILSALANRFKARFPQGEQVLEEHSLEEPSA